MKSLTEREFFFFFFFLWRYSPLWALACRTIPLRFSLSITNSLHLLTPSTWRSLSTRERIRNLFFSNWNEVLQFYCNFLYSARLRK